jgi:hypothetical protein
MFFKETKEHQIWACVGWLLLLLIITEKMSFLGYEKHH